jgi:hypothetical protein
MKVIEMIRKDGVEHKPVKEKVDDSEFEGIENVSTGGAMQPNTDFEKTPTPPPPEPNKIVQEEPKKEVKSEPKPQGGDGQISMF